MWFSFPRFREGGSLELGLFEFFSRKRQIIEPSPLHCSFTIGACFVNALLSLFVKEVRFGFRLVTELWKDLLWCVALKNELAQVFIIDSTSAPPLFKCPYINVIKTIVLKGRLLWVLSSFWLSNMNKMESLHGGWQVFCICKATLSKQNSFDKPVFKIHGNTDELS